MDSPLLKAHCMSCEKDFGIRKVEPTILCPRCQAEAYFTAICTKCNHKFYTGERSLGCAFPCPTCGQEMVCNVLERMDGTPTVVPWSGRIELHDLDAAMSIAMMGVTEKERAKAEDREDVPARKQQSHQFHESAAKEKSWEISGKIKRHRVKYRQKEPHKTLLRLCEQRILKEWAYLDDLPKELANTVANIYYNHCELMALMTAQENGKLKLPGVLKYLGLHLVEQDLGLKPQEVIARYTGYVQSTLQAIDEMINNLRQIDQDDKQEYNLAVDFSILTMKHDIDPKVLTGSDEKAIRRQFQENPVDEIPDLIDLLHL